MRMPNPLTQLALAAAVLVAGCGGTDAETAQMSEEPAVEVAETNPRFGRWQMDSDAPPPAINIMTYEAYGDGGMRITVEATNGEGVESKWGYVTMFDGEFRAVEGQENAETAVEVVDEYTNKISNMRNGEVSQVIMNVLSEDGNTINNEYIRTNDEGEEVSSFAVYRRIN